MINLGKPVRNAMQDVIAALQALTMIAKNAKNSTIKVLLTLGLTQQYCKKLHILTLLPTAISWALNDNFAAISNIVPMDNMVGQHF